MNTLAQAFHSKLEALLLNISSQLQGMKYSLGNTYKMIYDVINNAKAYGENSSTFYYNLMLIVKYLKSYIKRKGLAVLLFWFCRI